MAKAINYSSDLLSGLLAEISEEEQEKTDKRMKLAARIERGIKAKGWKKTDLAIALKKQPSVISRWLSGTHNFESDTLFDIERVLKIGLVTLQDESNTQILHYQIHISERVENTMKPAYSWIPAPSRYAIMLEPKELIVSEKNQSYNVVHQSI